MTVLDKVNEPKDIKNLIPLELEELAINVRDAILNRVSQYPGGHLGPNLGVVEMTVALHKVFNSPVDKLIWDVSHQSYPHKVLTGRKEFFTDKDKFSGTKAIQTLKKMNMTLYESVIHLHLLQQLWDMP